MFLLLSLTACARAVIPALPTKMVNHTPVRFEQVASILNSRCIACHSCLESPCQLNLQSYAGVRRGAYFANAYDGLRRKAVPPQRMLEDAQSENEWRARGFIDVLLGGDDSILVKAIRLSAIRKHRPKTPVPESLTCPRSSDNIKASMATELAMPYGLPALPVTEQVLLRDWITDGAPGPAHEMSIADLPASVQKQIQQWTAVFNAKDLKSRVVARYLFEHLFLAHLFFEASPRIFFRMVRSSSACELKVTPIASRRPNDDPGVKQWFYCLMFDPSTPVYKNNIPYPLSATKLKWLKGLFFKNTWTPTSYPSFDPNIASNPLRTFAEIPVELRYRFLLEDAQYEVMTFIKGPVCNGSPAVNSIQEQFYVFFIDPKSDLMARNPDYAKRVAAQLILPGDLGSNLSLNKIASGYHDILKHREQAREDFNQQLTLSFPGGLNVADIWDGDQKNDNAVLTVFRHDDNAKVLKGARGDTSKTIFVLDYSTFERLVYNLVINFDVFDNISHQTLTRLYMDVLRMDAENQFLQFLPPPDRLRVKAEWYKGLATKVKQHVLNESQFANIPSAIAFTPGQDPKVQWIQKVLNQRMPPAVRGPSDPINWRSLGTVEPRTPVEAQLHRVASVRAEKSSRFPNFFAELSNLILLKEGVPQEIFSIIRNREHENLSWILMENSRLQPGEDTLTILPGIDGGYPNQFFVVEESKLPAMIDQIQTIQSKKDFEAFSKKYAVQRMDNRFWEFYDYANSYLIEHQPSEGGVLDLSRYSLGVP